MTPSSGVYSPKLGATMQQIQAIIQQEAAILNAVSQQLPTIGMLIANGGTQESVTDAIIIKLQLEGQQPQALGVIMPHIGSVVARVLAMAGIPQPAPAPTAPDAVPV